MYVSGTSTCNYLMDTRRPGSHMAGKRCQTLDWDVLWLLRRARCKSKPSLLACLLILKRLDYQRTREAEPPDRQGGSEETIWTHARSDDMAASDWRVEAQLLHHAETASLAA